MINRVLAICYLVCGLSCSAIAMNTALAGNSEEKSSGSTPPLSGTIASNASAAVKAPPFQETLKKLSDENSVTCRKHMERLEQETSKHIADLKNETRTLVDKLEQGLRTQLMSIMTVAGAQQQLDSLTMNNLSGTLAAAHYDVKDGIGKSRIYFDRIMSQLGGMDKRIEALQTLFYKVSYDVSAVSQAISGMQSDIARLLVDVDEFGYGLNKFGTDLGNAAYHSRVMSADVYALRNDLAQVKDKVTLHDELGLYRRLTELDKVTRNNFGSLLRLTRLLREEQKKNGSARPPRPPLVAVAPEPLERKSEELSEDALTARGGMALEPLQRARSL